MAASKPTNLQKLERELSAKSRHIKYLEDKVLKVQKPVNEEDEETEQQSDLQARLEVLRAENEQLKADHDNDIMELQQRQNESLVELKDILQHITRLSRAQQKIIDRQKDEFTAAQQIAAETQLRQLDELQTLTEENKQLKQTLSALLPQQQQPADEQHQHGE